MWVYNIEEEVDVNGKSVYGERDQGDHRYDACRIRISQLTGDHFLVTVGIYGW